MTKEEIKGNEDLMNSIAEHVGINPRFAVVLIVFDTENEVVSTKANISDEGKLNLIREVYESMLRGTHK